MTTTTKVIIDITTNAPPASCSFCSDPIRTVAGTVTEQGRVWCCVPCYRADGGQAVLGS